MVAILAGDPGGAKALLPLVARLSAEKIKISVAGYFQAFAVWSNEHVPCCRLNDESELYAWLDNLPGVKLLLLGTSVNALSLERKAIQWGGNNGVPSIAVLDYWSNYRARFLGEANELLLPSLIAVMDDNAKRSMEMEGFPAEIVKVTGQPVLESLTQYKLSSSLKEWLRNCLLKKYGVDFLFVFVSQPLSSFYAQSIFDGVVLPFDEKLALRDVVTELDKVLLHAGEERQLKACVLVRRHPREMATPDELSTGRVRVVEAENFQFEQLKVASYEYVQVADLVFGMNSMLLLEGCYLKSHVLSYQPGVVSELDCLPSNKLGWSRVVYEKDGLFEAVHEELFEEKSRRCRTEVLERIELNQKATDCIFNHIAEFIN
ncbi:hypothetical protein QU481_13135 [Crenobacter sp. SG2303]|uniref:Uncharacterized protein n=1 Tax=Crenobacter oryzisoli TaxID=3056844 RepID=A0ABT7XPX0_9NEIS|nr:hypothetical protein [Crenobacter sp. SG2303]MDN0075831.1 hypothetical protein [Crenobacter sp. SG2303]